MALWPASFTDASSFDRETEFALDANLLALMASSLATLFLIGIFST